MVDDVLKNKEIEEAKRKGNDEGKKQAEQSRGGFFGLLG